MLDVAIAEVDLENAMDFTDRCFNRELSSC